MNYNRRKVHSKVETYQPTPKVKVIKRIPAGVYLFLLLVVIAIITVVQWLLR